MYVKIFFNIKLLKRIIKKEREKKFIEIKTIMTKEEKSGKNISANLNVPFFYNPD